MYIRSLSVLNGSPSLLKSRLTLYLYGPFLSPKESKINGIMMSLGKNRLNMVEQFCDSDGMKIDRIHCLNDSESCWTGSFIGKVLTRQN